MDYIKATDIQNTFTSLQSSNFAIFDQNIDFKNFWKGENHKIPSRIPTHRFVVHVRSNLMHYVVT